MLNIKEKDKLFNDGKYAEYLKHCTHQVRWLYKNSNKCLTVIPQRDVWAVLYKMEQRILELERGQNLNVLNQNASFPQPPLDICKCDNAYPIKGIPVCDVCGRYIANKSERFAP